MFDSENQTENESLETTDAVNDDEQQIHDQDKTEGGNEDVGFDDITIDGDQENDDHDGGETSEKAAPWIRDLRKKNRELIRENKRQQKELEEFKNKPNSNAVELPKKPTIEDCDYDAELFDQKYQEWQQAKQSHDAAKADQEAKQKQEMEEWNAGLDRYNEQKKNIRFEDYDEMEAEVTSKLSETQQAIIIQAADNPANIVYALGKYENQLDELSKIKDPIKYAVAVTKLETKLKVNKRKAATQPERTVSSGSAMQTDKTMAKLLEEADRTGDRTKVISYRKKLKAKRN